VRTGLRVINENYFQILARGGFFPKIFHNENLDSAYSELESLLIVIHNRLREGYSGYSMSMLGILKPVAMILKFQMSFP
jgi:hypothetical protein